MCPRPELASILVARDQELAPGLIRPEPGTGLRARGHRWVLEWAVGTWIEADRIREWRRLAPGGTPLWIVPDIELEATIDRLAASSRARTVELTYLLEEFDRRQRRKLNEELAFANQKMVRLTQVVVALTGVLVVLTVVGTIALAG